MTATIENASLNVGEQLDIRELTEGTLDGRGVLDTLLQVAKTHLLEEFRAGRITGGDYASSYVELLGSFLGQATQYALAKSTLALEIRQKSAQVLLVQKQIEQIEAEILNLNKQGQQIDVQISKLNQDISQSSELHPLNLQQKNKELKLLDKQTAQTEASINKLAAETAVSIKQGAVVDAQVNQVRTETILTEKNISLKFPVELENLQKQGRMLAAQTAQVETETLLAEKNVNLRFPVELDNLQKQGLMITAQVDQVNKSVEAIDSDIALKETQNILQTKQVALADYELTVKAPAEVAAITAQTGKANYELTDLLPAQKDSQIAQTNLYNQKTVTEKASTDASVIGVNSSIDKQNKLLEVQASGFLRDAEQKATKLLMDTWLVRYQDDPSSVSLSTSGLVDSNIKLAVSKLMNGVGVTLP